MLPRCADCINGSVSRKPAATHTQWARGSSARLGRAPPMLSRNASHRHGATSNELDISSASHSDLSGVAGWAISNSNAKAAD